MSPTSVRFTIQRERRLSLQAEWEKSLRTPPLNTPAPLSEFVLFRMKRPVDNSIVEHALPNNISQIQRVNKPATEAKLAFHIGPTSWKARF